MNKMLLKACVRYLFFPLALQKLGEMPFTSSKKLFLFSGYSNLYSFFPSFPHFPGSKRTNESEIIYDAMSWFAN